MGLWKKCGLSGIMLEKYVKENGISAVLVRLIVDKLIPPEVTKIEKGYLG